LDVAQVDVAATVVVAVVATAVVDVVVTAVADVVVSKHLLTALPVGVCLTRFSSAGDRRGGR
jgi:hypothetical protein